MSGFTFETSQAEKKIDEAIAKYFYVHLAMLKILTPKMANALWSGFEPSNRKSLKFNFYFNQNMS